MISIVTPCRNRSQFIEEALQSVLHQDYPSVEHIVVDGGSTDGTLDVLKKYSHIRVISECDEGMYDAINKGIGLAQGEIIGHLNTDDFYEPGVFAEVARRFAEDPEIDMVHGGTVLFEEDAAGERRILRTDVSPVQTELSVYNVIFGLPAINARFFRRHLYDRIGKYDNTYRITADCDLLLRAIRAGVRSAGINRVIYHYRVHEGSLTLNRRPWDAPASELVDMAERYLGVGGFGPDVRSVLRWWHSRQASIAAAQKIKQRKFVGAALYIWRGWRFDARYPLRFVWFGLLGLRRLTDGRPRQLRKSH